MKNVLAVIALLATTAALHAAEAPSKAFLAKHCVSCHDSETPKGNLDLSALKMDFADAETRARWVKVHDRIASGEMPPKKKPRPSPIEIKAVTGWLSSAISKAESARLDAQNRTGVRRLTRVEYENTLRDLFDMPGLALAGELPTDGSAHGFDKNSDALDISHVNLAKYLAAADYALDLAIATQPQAPTVQKRRISLANPAGSVAHVIGNGDGVLLKNKKPDPDFAPAGDYSHFDQGAHERIGSFSNGASVGLFRHEDESVNPYFSDHVTIYPGLYRVRTSLWSFQWDKGVVLPSRGTEAARLSVVQLTGDGRGGQHPSYVLGYYSAPSLEAQEHELITWLNFNEIIGFNVASLAPVANYSRKGRALAFTGPGIACDWLDVEGPLHEMWPPRSHRVLFGDLPLTLWKPDANSAVRPPIRKTVRQLGGMNRPDPDKGLWTVQSAQPLADADKLLSAFLPKAFRRPVAAETRQQYVGLVEARLKAGDCFESAMRYAFRAALCSPDFLYHVENSANTPASTPAKTVKKVAADKSVRPALVAANPARISDHALASRLSYFLWDSMPDDALTQLAAGGKLHQPQTLREQVERLLKHKKSQRFTEDFLGQWLKLRAIAANDPDKKLYPEFSPYLQDSMVAETRAYFRELIEQNLDASHLVKSDFAMINEKLATHYGIEGVSGPDIRKVKLPTGCPRGGFLTQAAILKVTANGTTTSPVPRGAFVMDRILGQPPEPPPPNIAAVEPDVRGTTTIREQLAKHSDNPSCASCHVKMDPPGFALEAFDVIGGYRTRYRSIGEGDAAPRGNIDPFIGIGFKLGPKVDSSGQLADERKFSDIRELQVILAADNHTLLRNLAQQLAIYSTGRDIAFSDRQSLNDIVARTKKQGGGVRTLIHELVQSNLFQTR